jgi:hypothetical protein
MVRARESGEYPNMLYNSLGFSIKSDFFHNTVAYRIVSYRIVAYLTLPFSVTILITLAVSRREAWRFFCLKFSVFPQKKSKVRTVPYLKFSVLIDLSQKSKPFRDYLKTYSFKKALARGVP